MWCSPTYTDTHIPSMFPNQSPQCHSYLAWILYPNVNTHASVFYRFWCVWRDLVDGRVSECFKSISMNQTRKSVWNFVPGYHGYDWRGGEQKGSVEHNGNTSMFTHVQTHTCMHFSHYCLLLFRLPSVCLSSSNHIHTLTHSVIRVESKGISCAVFSSPGWFPAFSTAVRLHRCLAKTCC